MEESIELQLVGKLTLKKIICGYYQHIWSSCGGT